MALVLNEVDGFDNVDVVEGRRYTKFSGQLLDVLLLRFIFATLAELLGADQRRFRIYHEQMKTHLDGVKLFLGAIPLVGKLDDTCGPFPDRHLLAHSILGGQTANAIPSSTLGLSIACVRVGSS